MTSTTASSTSNATSYPLVTIDCQYANSKNRTSIMTHGTIEEAKTLAKQTINRWIETGRGTMPSQAEVVCYDMEARELHREGIDLSTF